MADLLRGDGVERAGEALLRANGGRVVVLRMPAAATAGDASEELGLATAAFQDVEMGPAVFRKLADTATLLVSAAGVNAVVGSLAFDSVDVLFATAAGVVVDGVVYAVESVAAEQAFGVAGCYAVKLRAPLR